MERSMLNREIAEALRSALFAAAREYLDYSDGVNDRPFTVRLTRDGYKHTFENPGGRPAMLPPSGVAPAGGRGPPPLPPELARQLLQHFLNAEEAALVRAVSGPGPHTSQSLQDHMDREEDVGRTKTRIVLGQLVARGVLRNDPAGYAPAGPWVSEVLASLGDPPLASP
jgi:hypothetical protein